MSALEVDWDAGTENAYEEHRARLAPIPCVECGEYEAELDEELCAVCQKAKGQA